MPCVAALLLKTQSLKTQSLKTQTLKTYKENKMDNEILHPAHWKAAIGYANGVIGSGRTLFVGGQVGWNGDQIFESDDFVAQVHQTLTNRSEERRVGKEYRSLRTTSEQRKK